MAAILSHVTGALPVVPSGRIATGRAFQGSEISVFRSLRMKRHETANAVVERSCENARFAARVYSKQNSTTNVVFLEQCLVTGFVRLAQVIEQRTPRRHQLQQSAARVIVLHMRLEMFGQVVDAFRQDRDLDLRRTRVAGLVSTRLDDFRLALRGNRHRQTLSLRPELAVSPVRLNTRLGMSSPLPISASARSRPATVT